MTFIYIADFKRLDMKSQKCHVHRKWINPFKHLCITHKFRSKAIQSKIKTLNQSSSPKGENKTKYVNF